MKKQILIILTMLLAVAAPAPQSRAPHHFITLNSSTTVPISITTNQVLQANAITFKGLKAARTPNVGDVYIGFTSVDGEQHFTLAPGGEISYTLNAGDWVNLALFYLDVSTANDGVSVSWH